MPRTYKFSANMIQNNRISLQGKKVKFATNSFIAMYLNIDPFNFFSYLTHISYKNEISIMAIINLNINPIIINIFNSQP
jgi:hypothetical protein